MYYTDEYIRKYFIRVRPYVWFYVCFLQQCASLGDFVRSSDVLVSDEMRAFAEALLKNRLRALRVQPHMSGREFVLLEVTVHMTAVLLCANLPLLQPLQRLALSPNNMTVWTRVKSLEWLAIVSALCVTFLSCALHRPHSSQLCLMTC